MINLIFEDLLNFSDENIYYVFGLCRPKNNPDVPKEDRDFFRMPIKSRRDYEKKVGQMFALCRNSDQKMYVYVSVNARNVLNAADIFFDKEARLNALARRGDTTHIGILRDLDEEWHSACMKQESRGTKYYLLDIDDKTEETREKLGELLFPYIGNYLIEQETRNGYHWIVKPFDVRLLLTSDIDNVGIETDGLLYLGCTGFGKN